MSSIRQEVSTPSRVLSPRNYPLPPSGAPSRISTPTAQRVPRLARQQTVDEAPGGVMLAHSPNETKSARRTAEAAIQVPSAAGASAVSSRQLERPLVDSPVVASERTTPSQSQRRVTAASTEVQISKPRKAPSRGSASLIEPGNVSPSMQVSSLGVPSAKDALRTSQAGRDRISLRRSRAESEKPHSRKKSPTRGSLNLTIERIIKDTQPLSIGGSPKVDVEYTIYLSGHYAEGLSIGDIVFSGAVSPEVSRSRWIRCEGFRIRNSLRPRRLDGGGSRPPSRDREKKDGPLRVHTVHKTESRTILDIVFLDGVVQLDVVWDT